MPTSSRRSILQCSAGGVLLGFNGCLATGSISEPSNEPIEFCSVSVLNRGNSPHTVSIRLVENGEIIVENTGELPVSDGDSFESIGVSGSDLDSSTGYFTIQIQLNDDEWEELYLPDQAAERIAVLASIYPDPPTISFSVSADDNLGSCCGHLSSC